AYILNGSGVIRTTRLPQRARHHDQLRSSHLRSALGAIGSALFRLCRLRVLAVYTARVKLRKARYEQMSSALPPTTDIPARGPRGRPSFQIQHSAIVRLAPM